MMERRLKQNLKSSTQNLFITLGLKPQNSFGQIHINEIPHPLFLEV